MRFINRSHREGPLGSVLGAASQDGDDLAGGVAGYRAAGRLLEQYPLVRCWYFLDLIALSWALT